MTMKDELYIDEFCYEMMDVLDEKLKKYGETWKKIDLKSIQNKMKKQIEDGNIFNVILKDSYITREKTRRRLLHIANYCFFLFNRFGELT